MSLNLRENANTAYKSGKYNLALRGYNLAIMFGIIGEEELGLAYGNRSALFIQIKDPYLALRDIQLALTCKYPEILKGKLLQRQRKCNDLILRNAKDNEVQLKNESKLNGKKYCDDNVLRLKTPHSTITNAEEFVTIDYTKDRGRRLVVNRNVSAGKSLFNCLTYYNVHYKLSARIDKLYLSFKLICFTVIKHVYSININFIAETHTIYYIKLYYTVCYYRSLIT